MPQASDELREKMRVRFGDAIDMRGPIQFLESRGWKNDEGYLKSPRVGAEVPDDEWECVDFLIDEWDFWYELPPL